MIAPFPKALLKPRLGFPWPPKGEAMTFISAFRCDNSGSVVIGADSQETIGDYKISIDKLEPVTAGKYHVAIGGAGIGNLVDALFDYAQEWLEGWDETSERELVHLLRPKIREFYATEVAAYPSRSSKIIHAILCLKHHDNPRPLLFEVRGTTVRKARDFAFVGFETDILHHLTKRLYRTDMSISQAVLLTIYLFSIVSSTVTSVGGDARVVIARDNGIRTHEPLFVDKIQQNVSMFTKLIDRLILMCPDTSLSSFAFDIHLKEFIATAKDLREKYLHEFGQLAMLHALTTPNYRGDLYPMVPPGTVTTVGTQGIQVREDPEHVRQMRERMKEIEKQAAEDIKQSGAQKSKPEP